MTNDPFANKSSSPLRARDEASANSRATFDKGRTHEMMLDQVSRLAAACVAACIVLALTAPVRAEEIGRIPVLEVGTAAGLAKIPFAARGTNDDFNSSMGGIFGVDARLRIDAKIALVYGDGIYNVVQSGFAYSAHGGVVLATGLGGRDSWSLMRLDAQSQTRDKVVTDTTILLDRKLPVVYGLAIGVGALGTRKATIDGVGTLPPSTKPARTVPVVEAGFALISGQLELFAAPTFDLGNAQAGGRWAFQLAMPIGSVPLYWRMMGQHFFGSDQAAPVRFVLAFSVGVGTPLGVSASDN